MVLSVARRKGSAGCPAGTVSSAWYPWSNSKGISDLQCGSWDRSVDIHLLPFFSGGSLDWRKRSELWTMSAKARRAPATRWVAFEGWNLYCTLAVFYNTFQSGWKASHFWSSGRTSRKHDIVNCSRGVVVWFFITGGSLEVKLPTIYIDGKAEVGRVREESEEERSEKRKSQKKQDQGARKNIYIYRKVAKRCVFVAPEARKVGSIWGDERWKIARCCGAKQIWTSKC